MINVLSTFSGIGAFEKALRNEEIRYNLINYCEINKHASTCYSLIHNEPESKNLWDITKIDVSIFNNMSIDLYVHGSPCQSFSSTGKQEGGVAGSGTQSSLLWDSVRIIKDTLPRVVIWENVKNVMSPKHLPVFNNYIETLDNLGYHTSYTIISGTDFNVPQERERVFVVSTLDEIDFHFPNPIPLTRDLSEFCNFRSVDNLTRIFHDRYNLIHGEVSLETFQQYLDNLPIRKGIGTKCMDLYSFNEMNTITMPTGVTGTLTCRNVQNYCKKYLVDGQLYKPSPLMVWLLMGFTLDDFVKVQHFSSDRELYDRGGNSIIVDVAQHLVREIVNQVFGKDEKQC